MLPQYDKNKGELVKKWKMDRSCSWAPEIKEEEKKTTQVENNALVGWLTLWQLAYAVKMNVECPLFAEMLDEFEASSEQWNLGNHGKNSCPRKTR